MSKTITVDEATSRRLTDLAARYETAQFIEGDPSWWMHQVQGARNQEAMAFVAQAISYGSRAQFMPRIGHLLELSSGDMDRWLRCGAYSDSFAAGDGTCFYRLYCNDTMRSFFDACSTAMAEYGSLGEMVRRMGDGTGIGAVEVICRWFAAHGASTVVPKDTTSACKRICMFLRWMVRSGSPVDLGLWAPFVDRRTLIMPMDTHVLSEAVSLGLLQSRTASMSAARRLTDTLAQVFPDDPLRGDFALFGYGVDTERS